MLVRSTRAKRKAYDYRPWVYILRLLENVSSGIDAHTPAHTPRTRKQNGNVPTCTYLPTHVKQTGQYRRIFTTTDHCATQRSRRTVD